MSRVCERAYVTTATPPDDAGRFKTEAELDAPIAGLQHQMKAAAPNLEFEKAATIRDRIRQVKSRELGLAGSGRYLGVHAAHLGDGRRPRGPGVRAPYPQGRARGRRRTHLLTRHP